MKKEKEIWVDSYYYPEQYEVSNLGRLRNKKTQLIRKPSLDNDGYFKFNLSNKSKQITITAHRLTYLSFNPKTPLSLNIHHIDNNKTNNKLKNLGAIDHKSHSSLHAKIRLAMGTLHLVSAPKKGINNHSCNGSVIAICPNTFQIKYKMAGNYEMKKLGFQPSGISKAINGQLKQYKKFVFKRISKTSTIKIGDTYDSSKEA
jgi:hypothetical protein